MEEKKLNVYFIDIYEDSISGFTTYKEEFLQCVLDLGYYLHCIILNAPVKDFNIFEENDIEYIKIPNACRRESIGCLLSLYIKDSTTNIFIHNFSVAYPVLEMLKKDFPSLRILSEKDFNIAPQFSADEDIANALGIDAKSIFPKEDMTYDVFELKKTTTSVVHEFVNKKLRIETFDYVSSNPANKLTAIFYADSQFLRMSWYVAESFKKMQHIYVGYGRDFDIPYMAADIENFAPEDLKGRMAGRSYFIEQHDVLGIDEAEPITVEYNPKDAKNIESIFSVQRDTNQTELIRMDLATNPRKILINVPSAVYDLYYNSKDNIEETGAVYHSLLLLSPLSQLLMMIKHGGYEDLESVEDEFKWFKSIEGAYKKAFAKDMEYDDLFGITNEAEIYEMAQKMLGFCAVNAIDGYYRALTYSLEKGGSDDE